MKTVFFASFLERSNQLMEERADSIKSNTTQAMTKINTLEQENVSRSNVVNVLPSKRLWGDIVKYCECFVTRQAGAMLLLFYVMVEWDRTVFDRRKCGDL